jgi:cell division protein FtsB
MKAKRETQKRRAVSDRRDRRDGAARKSRRTTVDSSSARRTRPGRSSAPTRETRAPRSGPHTSPIARPVERSARPKSTSQAKARAKARKAKAPKVVRPRLTERLATRLASIDLRPRTLASKVPFVVLVIGALGLGLGLTLWLSTNSAERSYQLSHAREKNRLLQQQMESLERDVREAESAPALAEAARKQGMIPTRDTAHLVQDPAGNWVVVGTPKPADGVPPPPLNTRLPEPGPPPPPKPAALPAEVPVRVQPGPGDPAAPTRSGPEALLRAPDGSTTVGGQHLPQTAPQLPGMPGGPPTGQVPGVLPMPGLPAPAGPATAPVPAEVSIPLDGLPVPAPTQVPAPLPAEVAVPVQPGSGAQAPQAGEPITPGAPALAPASGEQFGPPTVTPPGAPR